MHTEQLANTSNTISIIVPTDEDLDQSPYDCPTFWIARSVDEQLLLAPEKTIPGGTDMFWISADGHFAGKAVDAFQRAVHKYADAVLASDPNPDKCVSARTDYRVQHVITRLSVPRHDSIVPAQHWDARTFEQGPVVLAIANGPFYAVALVRRGGNTLHIQSLNFDGTSVQVR
jgi:hypothetical protein